MEINEKKGLKRRETNMCEKIKQNMSQNTYITFVAQ